MFLNMGLVFIEKIFELLVKVGVEVVTLDEQGVV